MDSGNRPASQPLPTPPALPPARLVAQIAFALLGLFVLWVLVPLMPPQLLNPQWQHRFATLLADNSPLVILAAVLIQIAALLAPTDGWLQSLKARMARWLVSVMIGYLLLVPLDLVATARQLGQLDQQLQERISRMTQDLKRAQQLIAAAPDVGSLAGSLQSIGAPPLSLSDRAEPLPQLKMRLAQLLSQGVAATQTQMQRASSEVQTGMIKEAIRISGTCLVITVSLMRLSFRATDQKHRLQRFRAGWAQLGIRLAARSQRRQGQQNLKQHARMLRRRERQYWLREFRKRLEDSITRMTSRPPGRRR